MTRLDVILEDLVVAETITSTEAVAIRRCLQYSGQIADVSLGEFYREDVASLLALA